jgi:prepilin-type N-terminal cleavage/methylation domain-containing protein
MRRLGYTLLETVIVIAIIALLMALFYPCCVRAIKMARQVTGTDSSR